MIKLGYKVKNISKETWAVVVPGFTQDYTYFVSERFGMTITVIDALDFTIAEFAVNCSFAEILREVTSFPPELLAVICNEYVKRHMKG